MQLKISIVLYVNHFFDSDWLSAQGQYICRAGVCCVFAAYSY